MNEKQELKHSELINSSKVSDRIFSAAEPIVDRVVNTVKDSIEVVKMAGGLE